MLQVASLAIAFCMPVGCLFLYQRTLQQSPFQRPIAQRLENASPAPADAHFRRNRNICLLVGQRRLAQLVTSVARISRCDVILHS
jgi:hypothetical protein